MSYNPNSNFQQQLQDLSRQYQQLSQQTMYQPVVMPQPQQISIPIPPKQVQYVEGIGGAKLYQENMQSNSSEIIMDKNENIFYHVSKDANGIPSKHIPVCRFTIEETQEEPTILTRKDLDDFKEEIRQMLANKNSDPPRASTIITTYNYLHEKAIDEVKEIKILQQMYLEK